MMRHSALTTKTLALLLLWVPGVTIAERFEHRSRPTRVELADKLPPSLTISEPAPQGEAALVEPIVAASMGPILYSIGQPTDEAQLYLEFINRARANPSAEADLLSKAGNATLPAFYDTDIALDYSRFGVDLPRMVSQFSPVPPAGFPTLVPKPPLSFEPRLIAAAQRQTDDMVANRHSNHTGSDGSTVATRVSATGYSYLSGALAENIYGAAQSPWHGHAAFEVDWGGSAANGGMLNPAGHRNTIHSANVNFREIGIAIKEGPIQSDYYGPYWVTQVFASRAMSDPLATLPLVTGVAYYDLDNNGRYSVGEGIGGIRVNIAGANYYAITTNSGAYTVPVPTNGAYSVQFVDNILGSFTASASVTNSNNLKIDYRPTYQAPTISGPSQLNLNISGNYSITPVGGATEYRWRSEYTQPYTYIESGEQGLTYILSQNNDGYSVVAPDPYARTGTNSLWLNHSVFQKQYLRINRTIRPSATSNLRFFSRIGYASTGQVARVQICEVEGRNDCTQLNWGLRGNDDTGPLTYSENNLSLSQFAGKKIQVQFLYDIEGDYYQGIDPELGVRFEDIEVTNAEEFNQSVVTTGTATTFIFSSSIARNYTLQASAMVGGRWFPWGPAFAATVSQTSSPGAPRTLTLS